MTKPRFTTQYYYGRIVLVQHDHDFLVNAAKIISAALEAAGIPQALRVEWIHHNDGVNEVDANWNGKAWIPAKR